MKHNVRRRLWRNSNPGQRPGLNGFGDMYAQANSVWGHFLLMIQVLLGYVMLGALVTRFAVLFTAGGPAGEFSKAENN